MADPNSSAWRPLDFTELPPRLDRALAQALRLSRNEVRRLLEQGHVRVNRRVLTERDKGHHFAPEDRLEVLPFDRPDDQLPIPNPHLPLTILDESPDHLIIDKPAHMPVHPLEPDETDTALNAIIARYRQIAGVGEGALRSGVVHRLDLTTTGTLLFALNQPAWDHFRDAFKTHRITKQYLAVVQGRMTGSGHEQHRLVIAQHRPARVRVIAGSDPPRQGERLCSLSWRAVESFPDAALVSIDLGTGFLHQIRAIFAHLGHPLLGDSAYNDDAASIARAPRPMLHASRLALDAIDASAPMPSDMRSVLDALRM